jgi:hypothetical protein
MYRKHLSTLITVFMLVCALMIALTQVWGMSLKDIIIEVIVYALYGGMIAAYLLRFALILIGVFAVYHIIQEQHDKQLVM